MKNLELKIKELEMKIEELENLQDNLQENFQDSVKNQLDHNDVRTLVDQLLKEKEFATFSDLEQEISKNQVQLIKWIVGTGISAVSIIFGLIELLM